MSEDDTKKAMLSVLWVVHSRVHHIPAGYRQEEVAAVRSRDILDIITAPGQCEGFSKNAAGKAVMAARVGERVAYLLRIANSGGKPGRFASLLGYAQSVASRYVREGAAEGSDLFEGLTFIGPVAVTGRAYSWMTGRDVYHPGGHFVKIPDAQQGLLGGNRFFTLEKDKHENE